MPSPTVQFDHFITYIEAPSLEQHLDRYRAAGFAVADRTVRHDPGLRTGFVFFGDAYLEFAWVEDEALFAGADESEVARRKASRPWGIGFKADDVSRVHADWIRRGLAVPEVFSKAPRDAAPDAPPGWSFQDIPEALLPGAVCFVVTYHRARPGEPRKPGTNTIYAIHGPTFVSAAPKQRATAWRDLLAPAAPILGSEQESAVTIGPHRATWLSPDRYRDTFGRAWTAAPHAFGELAPLHLLASDMRAAESALTTAGWEIVPADQGAIFVPPSPLDGFSFLISGGP